MAKAKKPRLDSFLVLLLGAIILLLVLTVVFLPLEGQRKVLSEATEIAHLKPIQRENFVLPRLSAQSAYIEDVETGTVLFEKNADKPLLPASTTKIATALVVLKHYNLDQILTVNTPFLAGRVMGLKAGEEITVKNLLYGLLIFSANDAAEVFANGFPGGREEFIREMNRVAREAGLTNTNFVNPTGFDAYLHFSTARDLARLAKYAMLKPVFAQIVSTTGTTVTSSNGLIAHHLTSTNKLLGKVSGVIGVKTGSTLVSGESLVTMVEKEGHLIIVCILGSHDRFGETEFLISWTWSNYTWSSSVAARKNN